ncbi:MAG: bifunctional glycosyltransferase family 2/GtrA family protein [Pseudomonadota bacterium]
MYAILIPAFEPNSALSSLVDALLGKYQPVECPLLIVDDGSVNAEAVEVFQRLRSTEGVLVLRHDTNQGKGAALKTGISHIMKTAPSVAFVVTADADGQHTPTDILRVADHALEIGAPVIGVRRFGGDIPLRSKIGNNATRFLFGAFSGVWVSDTQTGLRAYHRDDFDAVLAVEENRYEFEFQALFLVAKKWRERLAEIPIETIYEPGNPTSHFNPIADSFRIYAIFLRHMSVTALTALSDFVIFSLLMVFSVTTLKALILSRAIVTPFYFWGLRNFVFKSRRNAVVQFASTMCLIVINVAFLWLVIDGLHEMLDIPRSLAMAIGIFLFYLINFLVQKNFIFRR